MNEAPLWSALGLWALKEIYGIYTRRSEKAVDDITNLRVRDGVREDQIAGISKRLSSLEDSDEAQWRQLDAKKGKSDVA